VKAKFITVLLMLDDRSGSFHEQQLIWLEPNELLENNVEGHGRKSQNLVVGTVHHAAHSLDQT
jgi:hypothetical protein